MGFLTLGTFHSGVGDLAAEISPRAYALVDSTTVAQVCGGRFAAGQYCQFAGKAWGGRQRLGDYHHLVSS